MKFFITYSNISDENALKTADDQLGKNYSYGIYFGYEF
jgi:hypothetical protein